MKPLLRSFEDFDRNLSKLLDEVEKRRLAYEAKPNSVRFLLSDEEWLEEFDSTLVHLDSVLDTLLDGNIRLNADIF